MKFRGKHYSNEVEWLEDQVAYYSELVVELRDVLISDEYIRYDENENEFYWTTTGEIVGADIQ